MPAEPLTLYRCPECGEYDVSAFTCSSHWRAINAASCIRFDAGLQVAVPVRVWPDETVNPLVEAAENALGGHVGPRLQLTNALRPFRGETT